MALIQIADIIGAGLTDSAIIRKIKTEIAGADQYVGITSFEFATDATAEWMVAKITNVGADEVLEWAGGSPDQTYTWADRATHTYS